MDFVHLICRWEHIFLNRDICLYACSFYARERKHVFITHTHAQWRINSYVYRYMCVCLFWSTCKHTCGRTCGSRYIVGARFTLRDTQSLPGAPGFLLPANSQNRGKGTKWSDKLRALKEEFQSRISMICWHAEMQLYNI